MHLSADLPDLTPDQSTALGCLLSSTRSLLETADAAGMTLGEFVMTLMHPACQAHLAAVTQIHDQRANARAAEAKTMAIDTLEYIAEDARPPTDKLDLFHRMERRRAAAAILRFGAERKREPRPERTPEPTDDRATQTSESSSPCSMTPSMPTLTDHITALTSALGLARRPAESLDSLLGLTDNDEQGLNASSPPREALSLAPSAAPPPTGALSLAPGAARGTGLQALGAPERAKAPHDQHPARSIRRCDAHDDTNPRPRTIALPIHLVNETQHSTLTHTPTQRAPPPFH
jgi:hypothetical protein